MFFLTLFTLSTVVPPLALFFTVDNQTARIYTFNTQHANDTRFTLAMYDMAYVGWGFAYTAVAFALSIATMLLHEKSTRWPSKLYGVTVLSYLFAFYAAVGLRFSLQPYFVGVIAAYLVLYSTAFHYTNQFTLDEKLSFKGNVYVWVLVAAATVSICIVLFWTWSTLPNQAIPLQYGLVLGLFVAFALLGFVEGKVHVHHFYWSSVLAFITGLDSYSMLCIQAMALAVFLHGMSVFGFSKMFKK